MGLYYNSIINCKVGITGMWQAMVEVMSDLKKDVSWMIIIIVTGEWIRLYYYIQGNKNCSVW